MTRRERFKQYMSRVAAAADPSLAIQQALYVHPPNAISDQIVGHFAINESPCHLVVGGIGSGKSTQLLIATQKLNELSEVSAVYVDVSKQQDLVKLNPGCLVALAGLALLEHSSLEKMAGRNVFTDWATGHWEEYDQPEEPDYGILYEGAVTPPQSKWPDIHSGHVEFLALAVAMHRAATSADFVVLFDSLDRTTNYDAFAKLIEQDIAALKSCNIGVVLIGPIRSLEGFGRADVERFDRLHLQGPVDVEQDAEGRRFLFDVLRARVDAQMLPDEAADLLITASGGVLRDLISLAKAAGDEAYLSGVDAIGLPHIRAAVDAFGRSLMIGLQPAEINALKHLRGDGGFVWTTSNELALLATRRILEYPKRTLRYSVHPTIAPLLDQKAG
jgi:hypothetical protein